MRKLKFNLEVTVNSFDDRRHDVHVHLRDADGMTRYMLSRAFDFSTLGGSIKALADEMISKALELVGEEKENRFDSERLG